MTHYPDPRPFEGFMNWLLACVFSIGPVSLVLAIMSIAIYPTLSSRTYLAVLAALTLAVGFACRNARLLLEAGWRKRAAASVLSCVIAGGLIGGSLIDPGPSRGSEAFADRAQRRAVAATESADQMAFHQARRVCSEAVIAESRSPAAADREGTQNAAATYRPGTNGQVISVTGQTSLTVSPGKMALTAFACEVMDGKVAKISVVPEADRKLGDTLVLHPIRSFQPYRSEVQRGTGG